MLEVVTRAYDGFESQDASFYAKPHTLGQVSFAALLARLERAATLKSQIEQHQPQIRNLEYIVQVRNACAFIYCESSHIQAC